MVNREKGETTHWLGKQRGLRRAILHRNTKRNEIVKRTNEHCHASDNDAVKP